VRPDARATLIAALLVVFAAGIGLNVGARARPTPTPAPPSPTEIALPSATPVDPAEAQRRALAQPLSSGCATDKAVWVFSDGGAVIRFDGERWTIPDPTLRSLSAAACRGGLGLAVGPAGGLLTVDDDARAVRVDRYGTDDLRGVAFTFSGAIAVGAAGTVIVQTDLDWHPLGIRGGEDLLGVSASAQRLLPPGRTQAWAVGAGGAAYRLVDFAWERVPVPTTATLRAVVVQDEAAMAVGDGGTIVRYASGGWSETASGTTSSLRAVALVGPATAWAVGDGGTVLEIAGDAAHRVDLGTACTLRAVFTQSAAIWVVGSDGARGGIWRVTPTGTDRWGGC